MAKNKITTTNNTHTGTKIFVIAMILLMLFFTSIVFAGIIGLFVALDDDASANGNVALIPVSGVITTAESSGLYATEGAVSGTIVNFIKKANENDNIKAIVVEINSPGGSPVASDEIGTALMKSKKPTVAIIREVGASGGYWVAVSTDHIIANRMSLTGSIGVIASYLEFDGLMNDYNVSYRRYVSGKYKDIGSPLKEATSNEQLLFQQKLDLLHKYFKDHVQQQRNLTDGQIDSVATGIFYLGAEAYDLGLVDELGGYDEVEAYLMDNYNITPEYVTYQKKLTFFDQLFGALNNVGFSMGTGLGNKLLAQEDTVSLRY